jgi:protein-L-isoaspartate(D-aspartate) O-methyltransferase
MGYLPEFCNAIADAPPRSGLYFAKEQRMTRTHRGGECRNMTKKINGYRNIRVHLIVLVLGTLASRPAVGQTPQQLEQARKQMVEECLVAGGIKNPRVLQAMGTTPRHEFVATNLRKNAYFDMALPIGEKQTISAPFIVGYMTEAIQPQPTDKVLEIGTGSGYQAAVLSPLVKDVYTIEIVEPLGQKAERTLKRLSYKNVHVKIGDGFLGWDEHAPFDKIIVTCSPEKVPQPLIDQLRDGGLLVIPVGERYQQTLYLHKKVEGKLESAALLPTLFVPMTGAAEEARVVKPDPAKPTIVNGDFEEKAFGNGGQPGWYYERQVEWTEAKDAPGGDHYVTFRNTDKGLPSHIMQGFAIDGRKVAEVEVSAHVRTRNAQQGDHRDEAPSVVVSFYDENRRELGHWIAGPVRGTADWHEETKKIAVPPSAREGILRIGMFGGTGEASFDKVRLRKTGGN